MSFKIEGLGGHLSRISAAIALTLESCFASNSRKMDSISFIICRKKMSILTRGQKFNVEWLEAVPRLAGLKNIPHNLLSVESTTSYPWKLKIYGTS